MRLNWPMIGILLSTVLFWVNAWYNGLFSSVMFVIIVGAMIGIFLRVTDRM